MDAQNQKTFQIGKPKEEFKKLVFRIPLSLYSAFISLLMFIRIHLSLNQHICHSNQVFD